MFLFVLKAQFGMIEFNEIYKNFIKKVHSFRFTNSKVYDSNFISKKP